MLKCLVFYLNVPHCLIKWCFSYLDNRSQRVLLRMAASQRSNAARGSWLGPLSVLIDDLDVDCLIHK